LAGVPTPHLDSESFRKEESDDDWDKIPAYLQLQVYSSANKKEESNDDWDQLPPITQPPSDSLSLQMESMKME